MRNATISFWIKGSPQNWKVILTNVSRISGGYSFGIGADPNKVYFSSGNSVDYVTTVGTAVSLDGTWHFITGVVDISSGKSSIYCDGQFSSSVDSGTVGNGRSAVTIGNDYTYYYGNFPNIDVDDIRFYGRAFSASEVLGLYNATK